VDRDGSRGDFPHHRTQAAIGFSASFMRVERLASRTLIDIPGE